MKQWTPEGGKDSYMEIKDLFLNEIGKIELGYFDPEVQKFYKMIQSKYTEEQYRHCLLWHLIIGSTPSESDIDFDMPDGEIEDFIRNRLPEIIKNRE